MNHMYGSDGQIEKIEWKEDKEHALVLHSADSSPGQSGSALLIKDSEQSVGVHVGYYNNFNVGTLITQKILDDFIIPTAVEFQLKAITMIFTQ